MHSPPSSSYLHQKINISLGKTQDQSSSLLRDNSISKMISKNSPRKQFYYQGIPMPKQTPHWNMSSSTLRHSSSAFRFASSSRFPTPKSNYQDSQQLQYPSLLKVQQRSIGLGKKAPIPKIFVNGKFEATQNCPFYEIDKEGIQRANSVVFLGQGKTFGIGWKYYQASQTPHRKTVHSSHQQRYNPGPNYYFVNPQDINRFPQSKIHQRLEMFTSINGSYRRNEPSPQSYKVSQKLIKSQRSGNEIGVGSKIDFTNQNKQRTPGPIYKQEEICDKFVHQKLKLKQI